MAPRKKKIEQEQNPAAVPVQLGGVPIVQVGGGFEVAPTPKVAPLGVQTIAMPSNPDISGMQKPSGGDAVATTPLQKASQLGSASTASPVVSTPLFQPKAFKPTYLQSADRLGKMPTGGLVNGVPNVNQIMQTAGQQGISQFQNAYTGLNGKSPVQAVGEMPTAPEVNWDEQIYNEYLANKKAYEDLVQQNEQKAKQDASKQRLAAIADALGNIANMYGVMNYGSPIQGAMSPYISEQIRYDEKMRSADMAKRRAELNDELNYLLNFRNKQERNAIDQQKAETSARRADTYQQNADTRERAVENTAENNANRVKLGYYQIASRESEGQKNREAYASRQQSSQTFQAGQTERKAEIRAAEGAAKLSAKEIEDRAKARVQAEKSQQAKIKAAGKKENWPTYRNSLFISITGKEYPNLSRGLNEKEKALWESLNVDIAGEKLIEDLIKKYPEWAKKEGLSADNDTVPPSRKSQDTTPPTRRKKSDDDNTPPTRRK